jgi:predicted GNAT family acetyltransferase
LRRNVNVDHGFHVREDPHVSREGGNPVTEKFSQNTARHRFELETEGHTALAFYQLADGVMTFTHTEVPAALGGRGVGSKLIESALRSAREQGLKVVAQCPFVAAYLRKHPEFNDLLT